jgi:hypothetical protein
MESSVAAVALGVGVTIPRNSGGEGDPTGRVRFWEMRCFETLEDVVVER